MRIRHELRWCPFNGSGARISQLSWPQKYLWSIVNLPGNHRRLDLFIYVPVAVDMTIETVISVLGGVVSRNSVLRTSVIHDAQGNEFQQIHASGALPVHIAEVSCRPAALSEVWSQLPTGTESYLAELIIILFDHGVRIAGLRLNHAVTDGWGCQLLRKEIITALANTCEEGTKSDKDRVKSSADLTDFEVSGEGKFAGAKAIEYARKQLLSAPQTMFPHPPIESEHPRYWNLALRSRSIHSALEKLAHSENFIYSAPIIGAFAVVLAARARTPAALIYVITNNRALPEWRSCVGPMLQPVVMCVPVPHHQHLINFTRMLRAPVLKAYRNGHYNPADFREIMTNVNLTRGVSLDNEPWAAMIHVNQTQTDLVAPGALPPMYSPPETAHQRGRISRTPRAERDNLTFFLDVIIEKDCVTLAARVDTQIVSLAEAEAVIMTMESLLCCLAAGEDVRISEILDTSPAISRPVGQAVHVIDGSLISSSACREALNSCAGVYDSYVHFSADVKPNVTAYIHTASGAVDARVLHRRLVARLKEFPLAMAPHLYRFYADRPEEHGGVAAWKENSLLGIHTGRISAQESFEE